MRLFWHQLKSEQLTFWRSREAAIFVFLFPPLLFVLLASVFGDGTRDGIPAATYLVAGLIAYAVANTALGGLAIMLVIRREFGILKRLRSTPLPATLYLAVDAAVEPDRRRAPVDRRRGSRRLALRRQAARELARLRRGAHARRRLVRRARAGDRRADPVRGGDRGGRQRDHPADGVPLRVVRAGRRPARVPARCSRDVLPLHYLLELVLGAYVDGEPVWEHPTAIAVLVAWGAAGYVVARRRFGWEPRER